MSLRIRVTFAAATATLICALLAAGSARAWDGSVVGAINVLDVTSGSNFGLRISLAGVSNMCTGGPNWAYLNDTDSNYRAYTAALMLAKAQGTRVIVYSNLESSYCHIGYISVQ